MVFLPPTACWGSVDQKHTIFFLDLKVGVKKKKKVGKLKKKHNYYESDWKNFAGISEQVDHILSCAFFVLKISK